MSNISDSVRQEIRRLLSQGNRVGLEYADARRFRTGSWSSAAIAQGGESAVLASITAVLDEHQGEYVQILGVDTKTRTRTLELMIQRPDGAVTQVSKSKSAGGGSVAAASNGNGGGNGGGGGDVAQIVRQLLNQGFRIGTEFADARRYRATSWTSGPAYQGSRENEAISLLTDLVAAHADDYVRLIGIDPTARRRVTELLIHKPGEPVTLSTGGGSKTSFNSSFGTASVAGSVKTSLSPEIVASVRHLLENSYQISTEHADLRRFRSSSWHTCKPVSATRIQDAISELEACLNDHEGEYVRLIGVDKKAKRRVHEEIIQRP